MMMPIFVWYKAKLPFFGVFSSSAVLSGFLNYMTMGEQNFAVLYKRELNNIIVMGVI
jgi:hypothetical protein